MSGIQQSESIKELATALAKAQGEFTPVAKTKPANIGTYSYEYADLADVLDMARPILAKHELAVVALPFTRKNGKSALAVQITHSSGEWLRGDGMDLLLTQQTPQGQGSAISYVRRQAISAALNIVTQTDDDGALASRPNRNRAAAPRNRQPRVTEGRGATDDAASQALAASPGGRATKEQAADVNAAMDLIGVGSAAKDRRDYLSGLLGRTVMSAGELDADEVPGVMEALERAREAG